MWLGFEEELNRKAHENSTQRWSKCIHKCAQSNALNYVPASFHTSVALADCGNNPRGSPSPSPPHPSQKEQK